MLRVAALARLRQISNAYGLDATRVPAQARHFLSLMPGRKAPVYGHASPSREQRGAGARQMLETLP